MNSKNVSEAVATVKEMKAPKHLLSEMVNKIVVTSLSRSDDDKELASTLIHELCTEGLVTSENLLQVSVNNYDHGTRTAAALANGIQRKSDFCTIMFIPPDNLSNECPLA